MSAPISYLTSSNYTDYVGSIGTGRGGTDGIGGGVDVPIDVLL